ncbi:MAG: hypothetical protein QXU32_02005 [Nitrososphaerales archaeon]
MKHDIPSYQEPEPYCKIGHKPQPHQPDDIYELVLSEFVSAIDPKNYFVTSGEAIQKAKKLEQDLWHMAGEARKLRRLLEKARGSAVYLETEWQDGHLILRRKNPRSKKGKE